MRKRFTWLAAIAALVFVGALVACSTKYSSSNNGLVVVSTQGDEVMETFSVDLGNGHVAQINNVNGPPITGIGTTVVLNPAGTFAYVATQVACTPNPPLPATASLTGAVQGAILAYPVSSDGKLSAAGAPTYLPGNPAYSGFITSSGFPTCGLDDSTNPNAGNAPVGMVMDSAGKYLFVATAPESATLTTNLNTTTPTSTVATLNSQGIVVYAIGSNASLTQVPGSPFPLPPQVGGQPPSPSALAVTPTLYPAAFAPCSATTPPTTENLYVTDSLNYVVYNASVSSSGALSFVSQVGVPTGTVPSGVTVDPCNRFVYVSNGQPNNSVSAYTICSQITLPTCTAPDFSLLPVSGSPFVAGNAPGPLVVDPFGAHLYVLDTGQNAISSYTISSTTGSLTPLTPATTTTNSLPTSIAIRSDGAWVFVTNFNSANVSQYALTPSSGGLTPQPPVATDNLPWGVAVK
jgi:DNA-binding beta-propeller fold protein YncE